MLNQVIKVQIQKKNDTIKPKQEKQDKIRGDDKCFLDEVLKKQLDLRWKWIHENDDANDDEEEEDW